MTKLDEQDERNFEATRRAEERILDVWKDTTIVLLITGIATGVLAVRIVTQPIDVWICVLAIAIIVLLTTIAGKLITKSIKETKTEFRKLEGFISISTARFAQEIEKEK